MTHSGESMLPIATDTHITHSPVQPNLHIQFNVTYTQHTVEQ